MDDRELDAKVRKATPEGFVVDIVSSTSGMTPQEFVRRVSDAVNEFLHAPGVPAESLLDDPTLAAAAREGFEANGPAKAYALGYAAGQAAERQETQVREAVAGTGDSALAGLREWIENQFWDGRWPNAQVILIVAEIDRRLGE